MDGWGHQTFILNGTRLPAVALLCDSYHLTLIHPLLLHMNIKTAVTSISKSMTCVIVPVYYSVTAEGPDLIAFMSPHTQRARRLVLDGNFLSK